MDINISFDSCELSSKDIYHENHPLHHMVMREEIEMDEADRDYFYSDQFKKDMQNFMKGE